MTEFTEKKLPASIPLPTGLAELVTNQEVEVVDDENTVAATFPQTTPQPYFFGILDEIIKTNYKKLPRRLMKDAVWLIPLIIIWLVLWPNYVRGSLHSVSMLLIFLTATYNGFIGKAVFITLISRTYKPLLLKLRAGERPELLLNYRRTASLIKNAFVRKKLESLRFLFIFGGMGLMISNLLTRNNKIDKYLVCLLLAFALFNDLSKGLKNPVIRLFSAGLRDIPMMVGKTINLSVHSTYLALTGFAAGLVLAFVPGLYVNSYTSPMGAIFGAVLTAVGFALYFLEGRNASK